MMIQKVQGENVGVYINGYVFKKHREINFFHANDITLEPLNITCENGKVEVN